MYSPRPVSKNKAHTNNVDKKLAFGPPNETVDSSFTAWATRPSDCL